MFLFYETEKFDDIIKYQTSEIEWFEKDRRRFICQVTVNEIRRG